MEEKRRAPQSRSSNTERTYTMFRLSISLSLQVSLPLSTPPLFLSLSHFLSLSLSVSPSLFSLCRYELQCLNSVFDIDERFFLDSARLSLSHFLSLSLSLCDSLSFSLSLYIYISMYLSLLCFSEEERTAPDTGHQANLGKCKPCQFSCSFRIS